MATLNQIAYAYAEAVGKADDVSVIRRIKFAIKYWREKFIRQDFEKNGLSKDLLQTYVDSLIKVNEVDSPCVIAGCTILRTANAVPKPVRTKGATFHRVGAILLGSPAWDEVELAQLKYKQFAKFTKNTTMWYYINNYIYVVTNGKFKHISITGVGADPTQWRDKCIDVSCVSDDDEFPIPGDYLADILRGLMQGELALQLPDHDVTPVDDGK